ncbi:TonB-dependent receptor [Apibacter raozihei]|uniref:TonB-dependent receptor n=1 Tax=Apibacter raozihei TaxID=2500547 RepID=UPI001E5EA7DE|nr:TonB-dependent receptor [Apibacter raozihei]
MKKNRKKLNKIKILTVGSLALLGGASLTAQVKQKSDTIKTSAEQKGDSKVMLNAANNTGPRDVNIGLPASVGGTTVLENGLPVVYFFWPEVPTKTWRGDAMLNKYSLYDLGQTAINIGDVGFSLSSYDNLGTDDFQGKLNLESNHYGLLRGSANVSGPINKKGLKYSAGAYVSMDPGTFNAKGLNTYYSDQAQIYKLALTQDYKFTGGTGSITALYKYANVKGIGQKYSPFIYGKNGEVSEVPGFKIGRKSYYERSGKVTLMDAFSGDLVQRDVLNDYGSQSNTIDVIGKNNFDNGLNLNYIVRYHSAKVGTYIPIMAGISKAAAGEFVYADTGEAYTGSNAQGVLILATKRTPIQSLTGTIELGKKSESSWGTHDWKVGVNEWFYDIDKYATESAMYFQEVAPNPRKLIKAGSGANVNGDFNLNGGLEYHNGRENKFAFFALDKWTVSKSFEVNVGARLEYQTLRGDYQDRNLGLQTLTGPKTKIDKDWFNQSYMVNAIYKVNEKFGLLGDLNYIEQAGHLENYNIGVDPKIKKSKIPSAGFGVFYNHPIISVVSKATYITRDEYRSTVNFSNPNNPGEVKRETTKYDIETIGWTTDIISKPFKNFELHFLLTLQDPKYKNFVGQVGFNDGSVAKYDFTDKYVTGISRVLIEIDPSYVWKDLRVWASARYFSKQYANRPNTVYFASRWETFAGLEYKINKHLSLSSTIINLLNQKGAQGDMGDADLLLTAEQAKQKEGTILSGTYIRPFTVEFGLKYNF